MTERNGKNICMESGCRSLEWKCADCGRIASTAGLAPIPGFSEWRDVKALPSDDKHVLVFDTSVGVCRGYVRDGNWSHYPLGSYASDGCLFYVTHWMPLPEPPA